MLTAMPHPHQGDPGRSLPVSLITLLFKATQCWKGTACREEDSSPFSGQLHPLALPQHLVHSASAESQLCARRGAGGCLCFSTTDIQAGSFFVIGAILCTVASLVSTPYMAAAVPHHPSCDNQNCPGGQKSPPFKTIGLERLKQVKNKPELAAPHLKPSLAPMTLGNVSSSTT